MEHNYMKGGYIMKVIGIQEKSGKYEGHDYHNFILHCTKKEEGSFGVITELVKIKYSEAPEVFNAVVSSSFFQSLIGKDIKYFCDKYGRVIDVRIFEPAKAG